MEIALAAGFSLASGFFLVASAWPRSAATLSDWLMKLSLATGFGLGISSIAFFGARATNFNHPVTVDVALLAVLSLFYIVMRARAHNQVAAASAIADFAIPSWLSRILPASFIISFLAALYSATMETIAHPHGFGWDAFSIWNLRARFLLLGGVHWRDGFSPLIPFSHPDYPLLLPAVTARFWSYLGHDAPAVPAIVGLAFTGSTFTLLIAAIARLRGRNAALLAGITLLSTPFFTEQGAAQYADVPLSFFILAAFVLLHSAFRTDTKSGIRRQGFWTLAGLSAGFAAWTKNEGLLFLVSLFLAHLVSWIKTSQSGKWRSQDVLVPVLLGALPILAVIAFYKYFVATAGDLFSCRDVMIHKLLTPGRYWIIFRWYAKEFFRFGGWWVIPGTLLLAVFCLFTRNRHAGRAEPALRASVATLGLTLAGYFAIYLITPRDLYWHLRFSLNRLFLQLWPTTVFLFFLFVARQTSPISQNEAEIRENH